MLYLKVGKDMIRATAFDKALVIALFLLCLWVYLVCWQAFHVFIIFKCIN